MKIMFIIQRKFLFFFILPINLFKFINNFNNKLLWEIVFNQMEEEH
jgi:hypothetical protein